MFDCGVDRGFSLELKTAPCGFVGFVASYPRLVLLLACTFAPVSF